MSTPPRSTPASPSADPPLDELRRLVAGRVVDPSDAEYDAHRTLFYAGFDRRPAAIVRPADAADVAAVVRLAARTGIDLAVRSGGHGALGHALVEGGVVLDLRDLRDLDIDVDGRSAWVGAGMTTGEYTAAVGQHGLATGFGDAGTVGIGGLTVGGGMGPLSRRFGLTIDHLLAAEVVTADGRVRVVDADTDPDLFWAVRGGGGNVGVVTRLRFRLHEVSSVVGGLLVLPLTAEVLAGFVDAARSAPDEVSTIANASLAAPPLPFLPVEAHGRPALIAILAHAGDPADGEAALAPFRALAEPLADFVAHQPYADLFAAEEEEEFHPRVVAETRYLDHFDLATAETVVAQLEAATSPVAMFQVRVLGGAIARVPVADTAYAHRDAAMLVNLVAMHEDPSEEARHRTWVQGMAAALDQGRDGQYVNFIDVDGPDAARAAWPGATGERLAAIKRRHDPDNLFRNTVVVVPD